MQMRERRWFDPHDPVLCYEERHSSIIRLHWYHRCHLAYFRFHQELVHCGNKALWVVWRCANTDNRCIGGRHKLWHCQSHRFGKHWGFVNGEQRHGGIAGKRVCKNQSVGTLEMHLGSWCKTSNQGSATALASETLCANRLTERTWSSC